MYTPVLVNTAVAVKVATPLITWAVPSGIAVPPLLVAVKVTVPVGIVMPASATVAVRVTLWPTCEGLGTLVRVVVLLWGSKAPMVQPPVLGRGKPRWSTPPTPSGPGCRQTSPLPLPMAAPPGPTASVGVGPPLSASIAIRCGSPNWSWLAALKPQVSEGNSRL